LTVISGIIAGKEIRIKGYGFRNFFLERNHESTDKYQ